MRNRIAAAAVLLLALLALLTVTAPPKAYAGWNGQQIFVSTVDSSVSTTRVTISGSNQNNSYVTFDRYLGFPGYYQYTVPNWWWKGRVKVTLYLAVFNPGYSTSVSCYVDVPTWQSGDWVRVSFNRYGCWKG